MTDELTTGSVPSHGSRGPNPGVLALVSFALLVIGLVLGTIVANGQTFVSPFSTATDVVGYFRGNSAAVRLNAFFQFGSAVPLGIYAATVYARQLRLGVRVPGPAIGFFGGISASVLLMVSAFVTWVLSRPEITGDAPLTVALSFLAFAAGGFGYVVSIGLLVAGIAVPALILRFVPRWFAWTGLIIAALSELSFLAMVIEPLQFLLPIGRFGGILWLIVAGFLLPRTRTAANRESQS
jgi:hypothetical protein